MNLQLAESPIIGRRFRPRWATTTTTTAENDIPEISIASETAQLQPRIAVIYFTVPYAQMRSHCLPPNMEERCCTKGHSSRLDTSRMQSQLRYSFRIFGPADPPGDGFSITRTIFRFFRHLTIRKRY